MQFNSSQVSQEPLNKGSLWSYITGPGITTKMLVTLGLFLAMTVILASFTINFFGIAKVGFGFLPIAMIAIMYGPLWAGLTYAAADILAYLLFPTGPYFPGITLTCFLMGLAFGIFLYGKEITVSRAFISSLFVVISLDFFLNTYWLHILMHQGYIALMPARIIKCLIALALETSLIPLTWNKIIKNLPLQVPK